MDKKILRILFLILFSAVIVLPFSVEAGSSGSGTLDDALSGIKQAVTAIGIGVAIIGFIVAGILYLTSGGGPRMEIAKKALVAAVIGTALVALSEGSDRIIRMIKDILGI